MIALGFIFVFCFFFIELPLVMYHKDEDAKKIKFIIFFSFGISIFICFFIGNINEYFIFLESTMEK